MTESDSPKGSKIDEFAKRLSAAEKQDTQTIMAATVCLLRDGETGLETLMLRKNSKIAFGGMWVFPGGRIDDEDGEPGAAIEDRARIAAVREADEETGLQVDADHMVWFSHWTPPEIGNRRFITWFYATRAPRGDVVIDDGEIKECQWLNPADAMEKQRAGEIELAPPTFVTLYYLSHYGNVAETLSGLSQRGPRHYATHITQLEDDLVALWEGDAGYDTWDANTDGLRHRLRMQAGGWLFENSGAPA